MGGLSLIAFIPLLLSGRSDLLIASVGVQAGITAIVNMPHFMASYRIVYRSREMILRHKWASLYVPGILLVMTLAAIWEAQYSTVLVTLLVTVSGAYLAWHYTGQVWGMMASHAVLAGTSYDKTERFLIRGSLRVLLAWHVTWFFYTHLRNPDVIRPAYVLVSVGGLLAFVAGAAGLARMTRRTGRFPPLRAVVAWLAIFVWYAAIARDPSAIFWVQIAHALQYLAFPVRVEINRTKAEPGATARRLAIHMAGYAAALLVISYLASEVLPARAMDAVALYFGDEPGRVTPVLVLIFINIHHYFTDGVVWKISNPEVRRELFAHVPQVAAAPKRAAGA
ncbi:MAG: hypothetical protein U9Q74_05080 [Gemmatimonadota bacterium]|nr:hypothetical protein [Gemmatimonadota bacterium]